MENRESALAAAAATAAVEDAKRRCLLLDDRLTNCNLSPSPKATLIRLIQSELNFLHRLSTSSHPSPLSFNIGHLEAVVHVLQQPLITGVSRVCKPISLSPSARIYVDIVCSLNGNPVWFIVSDRNPRYISWEDGSSDKDKGLKKKVQQVVDAARQAPITLRPSSVVFFFSNGLDDNVCKNLMCEFRGVYLELTEAFSYEEMELEDEWMDVVIVRSFSESHVVEIKIDKDDSVMKDEDTLYSTSMNNFFSCKKFEEYSVSNLGTSMCSLVSGMKCWCCSSGDGEELEVRSAVRLLGEYQSKLVNFDTTAMVAIVSGISNGGADKLLATPESELRGRFKGNYEFVIAQISGRSMKKLYYFGFESLSSLSVNC